jgi:galactokinase
MDNRGPLTAQGAGAGAAGGGGGGANISIVINAAPGMDAQAVAQAVSAELDRRERAKKSRVLQRSGLGAIQ